MHQEHGKSFVGFGFGPIQSALFLFEAYQSGNFDRFTVAEVNPDLVRAVRENGGSYTINIAHPDRIEQVIVKGVTLLNPTVADDREKLVEAIATADELCTALPSVDFFDRGGESSVAALLAVGMQQRQPGHRAVLYAAENNNHAAEILEKTVLSQPAAPALDDLHCLNTVVGKMSGVITDKATIERLKLTRLTGASEQAVLVEAFNRILVTRPRWVDYQRGITVFPEKDDLLPFEEAKLYGHNAIHALIGFLGWQRGLSTMAEAADHPDLMALAREAFIEESGAALIHRHAGLGDDLFTEKGFAAYAEDLLERMVNANLNDLVDRVIRDPQRKLAADDRLYGTMGLALEAGIEPSRMARGAAAAVTYLLGDGQKGRPAPAAVEKVLGEVCWADNPPAQARKLLELTLQALQE